MKHWSLGTALIAAVVSASAVFGQGSTPADELPGDVYIFVRYDIGTSNSNVPQVLPEDWPSRFPAVTSAAATSSNTSPWFGEVGLGVAPKWDLNDNSEIAIPVFYNFFGLSSMQKRFYSLRRPVAGVELDRGNSVRVQATALQKISPEIGLAYTRGRVTIHPSVQAYRLLGEDYRGDGPNDSRLETIRNLGSGLGTRIDVQFRIDPQQFLGNSFDPWNTAAIGVFYERNGGHLWQVGVSLRVGMELITRHRHGR